MNNARTPAVTIAILSSHHLVRVGLQQLIESRATVPMVVHTHQGRTGDMLRAEIRPDLVIIDLETECDVPGTITQIRESSPAIKIVLLCGIETQDRARQAFAYGVDGIILKVQPPEVVLAVLEALYDPAKPQASMEWNGTGVRSLEVPFERRGVSETPSPTRLDSLTEREREVIRLVSLGLSNKEIADKLSIADSTVRHHLTNIFDKLGVPNRHKLLLQSQHVHSTLG